MDFSYESCFEEMKRSFIAKGGRRERGRREGERENEAGQVLDVVRLRRTGRECRED